jgi:hypothetical protein
MVAPRGDAKSLGDYARHWAFRAANSTGSMPSKQNRRLDRKGWGKSQCCKGGKRINRR